MDLIPCKLKTMFGSLAISFFLLGGSSAYSRAPLSPMDSAPQPIGTSFSLIYLDSTSANLNIEEVPDDSRRAFALNIRFFDPWSQIYRSLDFSTQTGVLVVTEKDDSDEWIEMVFPPSDTQEYKVALANLLQLLDDFRWGHGDYTIGDKPQSPANPELGVLLEAAGRFPH